MRAEGAGPVAAGQRSLLRVVRRKVDVEGPSFWRLPKEVESLDLVRKGVLKHIFELLSDAVILSLELDGIDRGARLASGE